MNKEDRYIYNYVSPTTRSMTLEEEQKYNELLEQKEMEAYREILKNRTKQRIAARNTTKKQVSLKIKLAATAAIISIAAVGLTMHDGTQKIINSIDEANFVNTQVYSQEYNSGFPLFESQGEGIAPKQIDGTSYMEQLFQDGYNNGFTQTEMSIYAKEKYGTDYGLGTDELSQIQAKLSASIKNQEVEKTEGRGAR